MEAHESPQLPPARHPYLEHMPVLMLGDYHGRVVSPDGLQIFSICGHDIAPSVLWVVPYIRGEPIPKPCALSPEAVRLPLHFPEGLEHAARIVARSGAYQPGRSAQPPLVDIAKGLAGLVR